MVVYRAKNVRIVSMSQYLWTWLYIWMNFFFLVMTKLNFQHHYSNLQCHMILQISFLIGWFGAKETFIFYFQCWKWSCCFIFPEVLDGYKVKKNSIFLKKKLFCNIINVFTVTFEQFNASLVNKMFNSFLLTLNSWIEAYNDYFYVFYFYALLCSFWSSMALVSLTFNIWKSN